MATIFTCGIYGFWWEYDVMTDGNRHFRENWAWEDASGAIGATADDASGRVVAVQRHEFSIELDAPPADVWEVFWYRAPDRPQPKDVKTRIEILHPGDEAGNGLVRHCYFPVPKWLLSGGVGQSWEWLTEVTPYESWRYDAVGKPLWSRATGWTTLTDLGNGRTRVTFVEEYEAFNPIMRVLFEKRVHESLSRDNDTILAALEGGLKWHRRRKARRIVSDR